MVAYTPHRLLVLGERQHTLLLLKVPDLDSVVARAGRERVASGVEVDARHPVLVALAAHDEVARRQVPHLPCLVVRRCHKDGLGGVHRHVGDRQQVALELLGARPALDRRGREFKLLEGVRQLCARDCGPAGLAARGRRAASRGRCRCERLRRSWHRRTRICGGRARSCGGRGRRCCTTRCPRRRWPRRRGQRLEPGRDLVALDARQHLLLGHGLVLALELKDGRLVLGIMLLEPLDVEHQLVLLLRHALVVHAVEVPLLAELIPRRGRL
mmetsp:Transcript_7240/g.22032  ORF Transcript_7240/g.22032 Transcript_7240/m.22032 type:complete len:270 (+) Transcript_7240:535-1344(+)